MYLTQCDVDLISPIRLEICQNIIVDNRSEEICTDQDLRVQGGKNRREGRLEVCYNQAWGTICNTVYGQHAAKIFCVRLGFDGEYKICSLFHLLLGCAYSGIGSLVIV